MLLPSIEPLVILRMGKYFQSFVFTLSYIKHHLLGTGSSQITRFDCMLSNIFVQNINWQCFSVGCPAGLSVAQSDRVTGKLPLKGDMLTKRKVSFSLCFSMFFIFFHEHAELPELVVCVLQLTLSSSFGDPDILFHTAWDFEHH